jgi:zinc protease
MIAYSEQKLNNGLTLITHQDLSTPLVVVNLLYKVGSRNEHPDRTGFAHLFEHLMFGGSANVPDFDKVLHNIGAENNAFTNTDITNFYIILNSVNLETALWVESDRMKYLNIDQAKLDVQKNVVVEEFNQRYLNVPYGDVWLNLRPLAYKVHPYQWATIGKKPEHIQEADLSDVRDFYKNHYTPENAILTIAGNIKPDRALELVQKWFGDISGCMNSNGAIIQEPRQEVSRRNEVVGKGPMDAIYKAYHMPAKGNRDYISADLVGDLLGRGKSSRLYQSLVKDRQIFNNISAYITGSSDPGLLVVSGKVNPGKSIEDAEKYINEEVIKIKSEIEDHELEKVIHQAASTTYFSETELLNRAIALSMANSLGDTELVNNEIDWIRNTRKSDVQKMAQEILVEENCSTLIYRSAQ